MTDLTDTHAHLDDDKFANDLPGVLERAQQAGVTRIVAVATTAPSSTACLKLAQTHQQIWSTVGLHPNNIMQAAPDAWDEITNLVTQPRVVGVGETGLDRHWDDTPFPIQEEYFERHLILGRRHQKAIVIHCREAEADVLKMLRADFDKHGPIRGVMHSFTGDEALAQMCLEMGLYLSYAGMVTYKNAANLRATATTVPLNRLLVETDCPYLAPVPMRGQRNEPAFVVHTAACLAGLHGIRLDALAEQTSANALDLFGLE